MNPRNLFNFIYLALILGSNAVFADCILNQFGQELCVGDEVVFQNNKVSREAEDHLKVAEIKDINYNLLTIKMDGQKLSVFASDLIGRRDCKYYKSPFCEEKQVEIKSECQNTSTEDFGHSYKSLQLFYNDLVLLKQKGLFAKKKEIVKSDCLFIKE